MRWVTWWSSSRPISDQSARDMTSVKRTHGHQAWSEGTCGIALIYNITDEHDDEIYIQHSFWLQQP